MEAFKTIIWIINIFSSLSIIALVLMQHGKGADAGASFGGSGSAQGVFGSSGNANFLTRMTAIAAIVFFASCLALGYINTKSSNKVGSVDFSTVQQSQAASSTQQPAVPTMETASAAVAPVEASAVSASETSSLKAVAATAATATAAKVVADKASSQSKTDKKATDKKSTSEKKKSSTKTDSKK